MSGRRVLVIDFGDGRQRVGFACPACGFDHVLPVRNGSPDGPAWGWNGSLENPTFEPSILMRSANAAGPVVCHSFVRDGRIQFLSDCTHALAGQTIDLPELSEEFLSFYSENTPR